MDDIPRETLTEVDVAKEVMETRIVGVTEKGVLRKRSVKVKVGKEKSKSRSYGNSNDDYETIVSNVLQDKMVRESIETLKERLKMVVFMRDDCLDLVSQWQNVRDEQHKKKQSFELELTMLMLAGVIVTVFWIFIHWCW